MLTGDELARLPVRFICEAQMMLEETYDVRAHMHEVSRRRQWWRESAALWTGWLTRVRCCSVWLLACLHRQLYKGYRADSDKQLHADMVGETHKVCLLYTSPSPRDRG